MANKMNNFEKEKTDIAWAKLKNRLQKEDLLAQDDAISCNHVWIKRRTMITTLSLAAIIVIAFIIYHTTDFNAANDKHIAMIEQVNNQESSLVTTLSDGSIVYLGKNCRLEYPKEFADNIRNVHLKGKAFFEVAKNREKPFIIDMRDVIVEVVGTSFSISDSDTSSFRLNVRSGKVKVTNRDTNQFIYVEKGESVSLLSGKLKTYISKDDSIDDFLKDFRFKDQNLKSIVDVLNTLSNEEKIELSGNIDNRHLTVAFSGESIDQMATLIGLALKLHIDKKDNIIVLSDGK